MYCRTRAASKWQRQATPPAIPSSSESSDHSNPNFQPPSPPQFQSPANHQTLSIFPPDFMPAPIFPPHPTLRRPSKNGDNGRLVTEAPARFSSIDLAVDGIPPLQFETEEAQKRYNRLLNRRFENTRIFQRAALEFLGVAPEFYEVAQRLGIYPGFWEIEEPAFTRLTMEFLCILKLHTNADETHSITFRVCGIPYIVTEAQIAKCFHLQPGGTYEPLYDSKLMKYLTGLKDDPSNRRTNMIQHPVLRFLQRGFSFTIYARGESGTRPKREEISLLSSILCPNEFSRPNLAYLMMKYWEEIATSTMEGKGSIIIGGFVTHLARRLGVSQVDFCTSGGTAYYDLERITNSQLVEKIGEHYYWVINNHYRMKMPLNKPPLDPTKMSTCIYIIKSKRTKEVEELGQPCSVDPKEIGKEMGGGEEENEEEEAMGAATSDAPTYGPAYGSEDVSLRSLYGLMENM